MVKEYHVPGLYCPRCGKKGMIYKIMETIKISMGKLDFPHFRCQNCMNTWYDSKDVIALVVSYQFERPRGE